ncbi:MAG: transporter substrate-binding protein [Acidimicrobiia bacterium]|jgi:peptide/nickel transport system substrate-binding protein|nr:transporter substrate-binding protein [Acidimicrobiia bacterium]
MRRLIVSMIAALVAVSLVPIASAQEEDDQVTLRVGLTQDWEILNPTSGYTVAAYEVWNLHYATLTDKAADDFATTPGLAESWEEVEPGIEYVYTLREGLTWSDDEPITAEDVAWNINTGRDQGWDNMVSTVGNIEATAEDERTVRLVSSVPDPKLPTMDVYLVPQHIWEPIATDYDAATQYAADEGVGSGPFVMTEFTPGQSVVMAANPNYWGWEGEEPPYDQVIFRLFENPDAMVAALQQGEIDAAQGFPASSWDALEADPNIEVVAGQQGGFDEIAINGGAAEGQPHPALLDVEVRRAIAHGIDRPAVIEDLWFGLASPLETLSPSADPKWIPEIPEENQLTYDPDRANQILDDAGYMDTDGDGIREMPDGTNPLVIRHAVNTDGDLAGSIGDLMVGWMEEIGIGVELEAYDQDALFGVIVEGTYDTFFWGWVPFVDPDPMLSYFTEAEIGNNNDANWFDPEYDALYAEQNQQVDPDQRVETVHEMLTMFHDAAVYIPMYIAPDLQAYRTDTFEGWVKQPADIGPVMFSNTSPSYVQLTPIGAEAGGSGINWLLWGGIAAGVILIAGVFLAMRNRSTADDRE